MVTVDLAAIRRNAAFIADTVGVPVTAVVKANAYGHGLGVIPTLEPFVEGFAVATVFEAICLRDVTEKPILVLGCGDYAAVRGVTYAVGSVRDACAVPLGCRAAVKVNSGMNRYGCDEESLPRILNALTRRGIPVDSVFTHFSTADDPLLTAAQFEKFDSLTAGLGMKRHACAGNCLSLPPEYRLDGVRVGLALYGYGHAALNAAMTVEAPITALRNVKRGEHIGYGKYTAARNARIATVKLGYADGFRRLTEPLEVECRDRLCRVAGQVCMDAFGLDVSFTGAKVGDRVRVLGGKATMQALCRAYHTIPYEVLTGFDRKRTQTIYIDG